MRLQKLTAAAVSTVIACSMAVPAFAETTTGTNSSLKMERSQTVDGACMSSAVDKRDTALIAAFDTFSAAVKSAYTTRKDALKAAWLITDVTQRRAALKTAWEAFRKSQKAAREAFRKSKQAAWKQFKTDAKACKGNVSDEGNVETTAEVSL